MCTMNRFITAKKWHVWATCVSSHCLWTAASTLLPPPPHSHSHTHFPKWTLLTNKLFTPTLTINTTNPAHIYTHTHTQCGPNETKETMELNLIRIKVTFCTYTLPYFSFPLPASLPSLPLLETGDSFILSENITIIGIFTTYFVAIETRPYLTMRVNTNPLPWFNWHFFWPIRIQI